LLGFEGITASSAREPRAQGVGHHDAVEEGEDDEKKKKKKGGSTLPMTVNEGADPTGPQLAWKRKNC